MATLAPDPLRPSRPRLAPVRVCMFVVNGVSVDARVVREAAALAGEGAEVFVLGLRERAQPAREEMEGFTVLRLRRDPFRRGLAARTRRAAGSDGWPRWWGSSITSCAPWCAACASGPTSTTATTS